MTDQSVACHMQVDQTLKGKAWAKAETKAPRCRGAITLMRNWLKTPRDYKLAKLFEEVPRDLEKVFANPKEFVEYHETAEVKSWNIK